MSQDAFRIVCESVRSISPTLLKPPSHPHLPEVRDNYPLIVIELAYVHRAVVATMGRLLYFNVANLWIPQ